MSVDDDSDDGGKSAFVIPRPVVPNVQPALPEPTGNTKIDMVLHGARRINPNGTIVTAPIGVTPDGSLMLSIDGLGFTGGYIWQPGDQEQHNNGALVAVFRNGRNVLPAPKLTQGP